MPAQTGLALWLAVLVNRRLKGTAFYRTVYFAPVVTVLAVAATVWRLLYEPDTGAVNGILSLISFGQLQSDWLRSTSMAMPAIIIMSLWQSVGFQMVILLAGLQGIDTNLYEASAIDGASRWQQFRYVTLPGLRNQLIFVATITAIFSFRLFDQVYIMTKGGPRDATQTMLLRLVDVGFGQQQIGRGSAIAVVFFLIVLAITLVQRRLLRQEGEVQ